MDPGASLSSVSSPGQPKVKAGGPAKATALGKL